MDVSDDFNRADSADVGTNWTQQLADAAAGTTLGITTNQAAIAVAAKAAAAFYSAVGFANDQWAQCVIHASGGSFLGGPMVRSSGALSTAFSNYECFVVSATSLAIARHINGTPTTPMTVPGTYVDGDTIRLEVRGSWLTVFQNGTKIGTVRDTGVTSGSPGIILHAGGPVDNFQAGNLAYVAAVIVKNELSV